MVKKKQKQSGKEGCGAREMRRVNKEEGNEGKMDGANGWVKSKEERATWGGEVKVGERWKSNQVRKRLREERGEGGATAEEEIEEEVAGWIKGQFCVITRDGGRREG